MIRRCLAFSSSRMVSACAASSSWTQLSVLVLLPPPSSCSRKLRSLLSVRCSCTLKIKQENICCSISVLTCLLSRMLNSAPPSSCHLLKVTLIFCFKFLLNINSFVSPWCWTVVDQSVSGFLLSAPGAEAEDSCFLPPVCHDSLENTQT